VALASCPSGWCINNLRMKKSDTLLPIRVEVDSGCIAAPPAASLPNVAFPHDSGAIRSAWFTLRKAISFPMMMGALLIGAALIGTQGHLPDPDTWWHVSVGQQVLQTHTWPTSDPYSFTAHGTPWIAYEWLGEVAMALAARAGGLLGLALLLKGLIAVIAALLYYYAFIASGNSKAACIATAFVLPIAAVAFSLRPQLFGYVFLLLTLICLEHFRRGNRLALWFLPPLFMVWVNTHGTFVFGFLAIGIYWASGLLNFQMGGLTAERWTPRQRSQLLLTTLLCVLALLVTPYGSRLAAYPLEMATSQPVNIAHIQEWQPLSFDLGIGKYLLGFVLAIFLAQVIFRLSFRLHELAMLFFAAYAACVHIRFVLIFTIFLVPIVATILARWVPPYDAAKDRHVLNVIIMAFVVIGLVKLLPSRRDLDEMVAKDYPVRAVAYLRQNPQPSQMFNEYGWGGYLIWQLPEHKVFIDGRGDLYEYSGVFKDYIDIASLNRNTFQLLRKYGVQSCLVQSKSPLATLLSASPEWTAVYTDELSTIFVGVHKPQTAAGAARFQNVAPSIYARVTKLDDPTLEKRSLTETPIGGPRRPSLPPRHLSQISQLSFSDLK
jgi:hypothetical protein